MLAWLSVWSEVQICIWPSWCHCHSLSLAPVKSRLVLPFWYRLTWVVPDKGPLNGCVTYLNTEAWACGMFTVSAGTLLILSTEYSKSMPIGFVHAVVWCIVSTQVLEWQWITGRRWLAGRRCRCLLWRHFRSVHSSVDRHPVVMDSYGWIDSSVVAEPTSLCSRGVNYCGNLGHCVWILQVPVVARCQQKYILL